VIISGRKYEDLSLCSIVRKWSTRRNISVCGRNHVEIAVIHAAI